MEYLNGKGDYEEILSDLMSSRKKSLSPTTITWLKLHVKTTTIDEIKLYLHFVHNTNLKTLVSSSQVIRKLIEKRKREEARFCLQLPTFNSFQSLDGRDLSALISHSSEHEELSEEKVGELVRVIKDELPSSSPQITPFLLDLMCDLGELALEGSIHSCMELSRQISTLTSSSSSPNEEDDNVDANTSSPDLSL